MKNSEQRTTIFLLIPFFKMSMCHATASISASFSPLRLAGRATIIGEWGFCYDEPSYNQQILSAAIANNAGLTYFHTGEVTQGQHDIPQINANGLLVQMDYATIFRRTP